MFSKCKTEVAKDRQRTLAAQRVESRDPTPSDEMVKTCRRVYFMGIVNSKFERPLLTPDMLIHSTGCLSRMHLMIP
jgi:hypothetical protein